RYLGLSLEELEARKAVHTAREIENQPDLWMETYLSFLEQKDEILKFIDKFQENESPCIVLTGAGSSAFVGESLAGPFQMKWKGISRAVSTTDIITHPQNYFDRGRPTLLIS